MIGSLFACTSGDNKKKIDFGVVHPLVADTLIEGMRTGKYFPPYIIRLGGAFRNAFIRIDTNLAGVPMILKGQREAYYTRAITETPQEDLEIQRRVWKLKELQALQRGDGGSGTLFTVIRDRPSKSSNAWVLEVHENQLREMPLSTDIAYIKINTKTGKIEIATASEYYVPLERWRKVIR